MQPTRTSKFLDFALFVACAFALFFIVSTFSCINRYFHEKKVAAQQKARTMAGEWQILSIEPESIVLSSLKDEQQRLMIYKRYAPHFPRTAVAGDRITIAVPPPGPDRQSRVPESYLQFKLQ